MASPTGERTKISGITAFHEKKTEKNRENEPKDTLKASSAHIPKVPKRLRDYPSNRKLRFVLFPDDPFIVFWIWLRTVAVFYSCTMAPFKLSFIEDNELGNELVWTAFDFVLDLVFWIDLVLNFFTAFFDIDNILVVSKRKIFLNYIFGWFLMDLLSSIPFDLVSGADINIIVRLSKIPRLLKVFRVLKVMRLVRVVKSHSFFGGFFKHPQAFRLVLSIGMYLIVFHVVSCLWFFVASYDDFQDSDNWVLRLGYMESSAIEVILLLPFC